MILALKFHGVELLDPPHNGCLRHGLLRLLQVVWATTYDDRWFDRKALQAIHKLQDTIFKFDRVAMKFNTAIECLPNPGVEDQAALFRHLDSLYDIPILLDSLLFYFRIQADCIANVIPNLYGARGATANIPRDSFRRQATWFLRKNQDFDPPYRRVLEAKLEWFDTLSGSARGQGLRDIIAHYRGTYQVGWISKGERNTAPVAGLVNESGFIEENVIPVLSRMVFQYFDFLDEVFTIFIPRLRASVGNSFWSAYQRNPEESTRLYTFSEAVASRWIYPNARFCDAP